MRDDVAEARPQAIPQKFVRVAQALPALPTITLDLDRAIFSTTASGLHTSRTALEAYIKEVPVAIIGRHWKRSFWFINIMQQM